MSDRSVWLSRRALLSGAGAATLAAAAAPFPRPALAQRAPLKGRADAALYRHLCPLGQFIDDGFRLYVEQKGGRLGGRDIAFVQVDDESKPEAATDNMNRLVGREKADVVVGTVHSGVAMAMLKVARDTNTLMIIPNAGANDATGPACAPNLFRTSFSNWQTTHPAGRVLRDAGVRRVATLTWRYTAGAEMMSAFAESFTSLGGTVVESLTLPFPEVEFQALLTRVATLKPDAVFSFFAAAAR